MPTKLSRYSDGIMEAAWLAAVIVVPVFFNVFSSRIFEPDKLTLLRTLALVILAAWAVKLVEAGGFRWERLNPGASRLKAFLRFPLVLPVIALVVVYLISTIFSVNPGTSLWGSYQRLQGTYTTFSYLVVFAAITANLRRRDQVERLITTLIVASLAVSLYGVLQRFQIDPVPWGGNVSARIAANMGNSIFVAAYLIMVFPLAVLRIVQSFGAILASPNFLLGNFLRATGYVFIAALQVIALYFSGSRGPWLGWAASLVFIGLVLSLIYRKRWLTISGVGLALAAAAFLVVLNIPGGPLEGLRSVPGIGRLGQLLDAESRTGRVRELIWEGAVELVLPHEPLEYPDGQKDPFNFLRPLVGYGPESMYVAYNPFYRPELTQVEKRNATPDRSHNETFDSLVITGALGLLAYLTLFGSVFYYGLKWLGLMNTASQRNLYLGLYVGGGILSAVIFVLWKGAAYFGVGLPFGIMIGLIVYLILVSLFGQYEVPQTEGEKLRALTLMALLAVIVAHFVEINFGIAIAVTRTYFWVLTGLLLVTGYILPRHGEFGRETAAEAVAAGQRQPEQAAGELMPERGGGSAGSRKKRRAERAGAGRDLRAGHAPRSRPGLPERPDWLRQALTGGFLVGILIATLGFNYISNSGGGTAATSVLWTSLVSLKSSTSGISYGLLAMILTSWFVGSVLVASEVAINAPTENHAAPGSSALGKTLLTVLGVSLLLGLFFWLWHSSGLASIAKQTAGDLQDVLAQIGRYENLLTRYTFFLLLTVFGMAAFLPAEPLSRTEPTARRGAVVAPFALVIALALAATTNLRIIQADIAFKLAEPFARGNTWPVAIAVYNRANDLAPTEDYYYLFLGRAYLDYSRTLTDANERERLIAQAASDLRKAQDLSPLNTDHTANLARLYSLWASYSNDPQVRAERAQTSSDYFNRALVLSPNNARIWDEWALLYLNILEKPDEAFERLDHAVKIDPFYDWTYGLMGEYYTRRAREISAGQEEQKQAALDQAAEAYQQALQLASPVDTQNKYSYALALGGVEIQRGQTDQAIAAYQQAIETIPNSQEIWRIEEAIARIYFEKGDVQNALAHAQAALAAAPDDQKERLTTMVTQWQGQ